MYQYSGPRITTSSGYLGISWETYIAISLVCGRTVEPEADRRSVRKYTYLKIGVKKPRPGQSTLPKANKPYVDKNRIGIWGWAMADTTLMSMSEGTPVFKSRCSCCHQPTGVSPPLYRTFLAHPEENAEGYKGIVHFPGWQVTAICCWYMVWRMIMFTSRTVPNTPSIWCNWANNLIASIPIVIMAYTAWQHPSASIYTIDNFFSTICNGWQSA